MDNKVNERIVYGISGLMIGLIFGLVVTALNDISGNDATIIMVGFSATFTIFFAFFHKIAAFFMQFLMNGSADGDADFEIEPGMEPSADEISDLVDRLPNNKPNPWARAQRNHNND